jgi:hypothetical protein
MSIDRDDISAARRDTVCAAALARGGPEPNRPINHYAFLKR